MSFSLDCEHRKLSSYFYLSWVALTGFPTAFNVVVHVQDYLTTYIIVNDLHNDLGWVICSVILPLTRAESTDITVARLTSSLCPHKTHMYWSCGTYRWSGIFLV